MSVAAMSSWLFGNNGQFSYSRLWTGTSLQWRLIRGNIVDKRFMSFIFETIPRFSKLIPVLYTENTNVVYWLEMRVERKSHKLLSCPRTF